MLLYSAKSARAQIFFGRPPNGGTRAMRLGTSRKMPRKSTGLTDRLTLPMRPELLREIDQVRGDVPRVAWIRRELAVAVTRHRPRPGTPALTMGPQPPPRPSAFFG